jgi:plastocyanin
MNQNDVNRIRDSYRASTNVTPAARSLDRRSLLKAGGALGLTGLALTLLPGGRNFAGAHSNHQDAAASPVPGPQADGTNLWKVQVGNMDMENKLDLQGFFPGEITINAGDQIWFAEGMPGFHSVYFGYGAEPPALIVPDPEQASPEAGAPPQMVLNPEVAFPGPNMVVDGTNVVNTGVDILWDPAVPTIVTFSTPGTYEYLCVPHQGVMRATVIVQEAGAALPMDQAGYDALAQEQMAALVEEGLAATAEYAEATAEEQADGTTLWTAAAGAGEGQARVMQFLPNALEIKVGDSVKWINHSIGEPHTVTFVGEGETPPEDIMPAAFADGSPKFAINPMTLFPQGGDTFDGTGYLNSGYFGLPGTPTEFTATFTAPGEYIYYCILHGDAEGGGMAATLTVVE